jgi:hypothetical protein
MHLTLPALTTLLLSTTTAAISNTATYKLAIGSRNPSLSNTTVVLKDDSAPASSPNALGIYSSGAPRSPYTFTITTNSSADDLYEFRGADSERRCAGNGAVRRRDWRGSRACVQGGRDAVFVPDRPGRPDECAGGGE